MPNGTPKMNGERRYRADLKAEIARAYLRDSIDFLFRFDLLLEEYSKSKRMKCFVDLLMGFECALKAHIFLSDGDQAAEELYAQVRKCGHNLTKLTRLAHFTPDEKVYQKVEEQLGTFSVVLRYSLDSYESFFPSGLSREEADYNYSETLANHRWLIEIRGLLNSLIEPINNELSGMVDLDLEEILDSEKRLRDFALKVGIVKA
jgi:hypothetical protein